MNRMLMGCLVCLSFTSPLAVASGDEPHRPVPLIKVVAPETARPAAPAAATGEFLDKSTVASLYLIQGEKTIEVKITTQTADTIKFVIPGTVEPGRYQLMVLTKGLNPQYIEEPVMLVIE